MASFSFAAGFAMSGDPRAVRAAGDGVALSATNPSLDLALGQALFERSWVSAPASTASADGLGPLYNARSCAACHRVARRPPTDASGQLASAAMAFRLVGPAAADPRYGVQLQTAATHGLPAEGRMSVDYEEIPVALTDNTVIRLQRPVYGVTDLGYGPLDRSTVLSPRVPPLLAGLGPLESIDPRLILDWADPDDADGDGISGRPGPAADCRELGPCIGRFGWKASSGTIDAQVALAFSLDMGMSTPLQPAPWGDCTPRQGGCLKAPHGADHVTGATEIGAPLMELIAAFLRAQPMPASAGRSSSPAATGEAVFADVGCAACHRPSYSVVAADGTSQTIRPYSDLLLHDLGDGLRDAQGAAGEWRTAPLWGLGALERRPGPKAYLHDGRARSLEEAVLWHGGEAERAAAAVRQLTAAERSALLEFLRSL